MPASWASTILLCAGFAVLSLRQTKYIISDDIDDLKGRSGGRRHLPRTDDAYADDDDLSSDHGGIIASEDVDGDDDRPGDDIHEYDALGGMADGDDERDAQPRQRAEQGGGIGREGIHTDFEEVHLPGLNSQRAAQGARRMDSANNLRF